MATKTKSGKYVKQIVSASFHRNGVCGVGFYAILFDTPDGDRMIASLFDDPGYCAVYSVQLLGEGNIKFANGNSLRGDNYESELRPMLQKFMKENGSNRVGPFAL